MKLNFLGDSITEGACVNAEEVYVKLVGERTGALVRNYGVGGTRIARQTHRNDLTAPWDEDFNFRAAQMDEDADFVFVFGGTNDYGHGDAPLGSPEDTDVYTFYGALKTLTEFLINRYGKDKLCFILPMPRWNEDDPMGGGGEFKTQQDQPLEGYRKAIKEILMSYGVDFLDLKDKFPPEKLEELTADGLHPNAEGHILIAESVCAYLEKKLSASEN